MAGNAAATEYPLAAIGKVITPSGAVCTGTVIAPDTVLTAAHCLVNRSGTRIFRPVTVHFAAGLDEDGVDQYAKSTAIRLSPGYDAANKEDHGNFAEDWALLTLQDPIHAAGKGIPVAYDLPMEGLSSAAYSRSFRRAPRLQRECSIIGEDPPLVLHDCPVEPGASGGPILTSLGKDARLVAIHIATVSVNGEKTGIALPIAVIGQENLAANQP